jgi:hypothetical protein
LEILYEKHGGRGKISLTFGEVLQEASRLVEAKSSTSGNIFGRARDYLGGGTIASASSGSDRNGTH